MDTFSKYTQACVVNSANAIEIVNSLSIFSSYHGIPKTIISNNGTEFKTTLVKDLLTTHKIEIHHPQSNGTIERLQLTLLEPFRLLKSLEMKTERARIKMIYALVAYNNTVHCFIKLKPIASLTDTFRRPIPLISIWKNDSIIRYRGNVKNMYSKLI